MVRQAHFIAVVGALLLGFAVLLVVGCSGVRSEAPQEEQENSPEATKLEQAHSPEATAPEEGRCAGTRTIKPPRTESASGSTVTNDVPGCPKGGLLSGTDKPDQLAGKDGDDKIRGLGAADVLMGGSGSDVIYGGPGFDQMWAGPVRGRDTSKNKLYGGDRTDDISGADGEDVLYGGDGNDWVSGGKGEDVLYGEEGNDHMYGDHGEDVLYGGGGNDTLSAASYKDDRGTDKLYCGAGTDKYLAGRLDYVSSSCEVKQKPAKPKKGRAVPL